MTQQLIESLLRQKIGLDAVSIGSNTIARVVRRRMEDCRINDMGTYFQLLQNLPQELEDLIEEVVIPETWFFRDKEPFVYLSNYVKTEWMVQNFAKTLRVLSVPCSTGEEPYSIAIALLDAGLFPGNFTIDAVDISHRSIHRAKQAIYGKNSFRGNDLTFRDRYFTVWQNDYHLSPSVKSTVNFIRANLLDPFFLSEKFPYDIIFCRNVLIYFDQRSIDKTLQTLDRLLNKNGLLFVGHSETGQLLYTDFVSVRHSFAFAYRKAEKEGERGRVGEGANLPKKVPHKTPLPAASFAASSISFAPSSSPTPPLPSSRGKIPDLAEARRLADLGQLEAAAQLCETYLNQNRASAAAYFLLGQVYQAAKKETQAEQCFQKVIYLEPNHYEALTHLVLLKEHRKDFAGAAILRGRIERLQKLR